MLMPVVKQQSFSHTNDSVIQNLLPFSLPTQLFQVLSGIRLPFSLKHSGPLAFRKLDKPHKLCFRYRSIYSLKTLPSDLRVIRKEVLPAGINLEIHPRTSDSLESCRSYIDQMISHKYNQKPFSAPPCSFQLVRSSTITFSISADV